MDKSILVAHIYDSLECIKEDVNYFNDEINKRLTAMGCDEEIKFAAPIDKDIEAVKSLLGKLSADETMAIKQLINHCQLSGEIQACNQQQLEDKISGMAELINEIPVAEIDVI